MIGTGLIALCILVAGIAGAVLSLPNDSDMAFMRFKDGEYAAAQEGFERAWRAGDVSINTVMPLVAIHDANARPNQAIKFSSTLSKPGRPTSPHAECSARSIGRR
jgi:hypothetical protein